MRFGIVGDLHGNLQWASHIANEMGDRKITHVFVVGDFGLWTHKAEGHEFLDGLEAAGEANHLTWYAVGGNHENWDHWNWFVENMPTHKGMAFVRRRVLLSPKINEFRLAGKQFVIAGGAVSVDKDWRLAKERGGLWFDKDFGHTHDMGRGTGPRTLWWPDEQLTDQDVKKIESTFPKADILLTHDCSNYTQFRNRLKPDADSERHRRRIDEVLRAVNPSFHFHGHMHESYDWTNTLGTGMFGSEPEYSVQTYGMEADPAAMRGKRSPFSWGVFDTDTMEFAYSGKGMQFRSLES